MGTIINLIGKRFGKLFVVDKSKKERKVVMFIGLVIVNVENILK